MCVISTGGNGGMLRNFNASYLLYCRKNMTKIIIVQVVWTDLYGLFYGQGIRKPRGLKKPTEWAIRRIFDGYCSKTK
jgi:hypothetical protein